MQSESHPRILPSYDTLGATEYLCHHEPLWLPSQLSPVLNSSNYLKVFICVVPHRS